MSELFKVISASVQALSLCFMFCSLAQCGLLQEGLVMLFQSSRCPKNIDCCIKHLSTVFCVLKFHITVPPFFPRAIYSFLPLHI